MARILRYEVHYWTDLDGKKEKMCYLFNTLKEARAFIRRALPDYEITKSWRERLYNGYGFTRYVGDAKIIFCERVEPLPQAPPADPAEDHPDLVLNNPGGWF